MGVHCSTRRSSPLHLEPPPTCRIPTPREAEAQSNAGLITRHKATHEALQNALTAAAQRRRAALAASGAAQRRELLGAASAQGLSAAAAAQRAAAASSRLATSQNVTQGLKRARQVLAEELQHTSATLAALDSSHGQLRGARDEYVGQAPLLKRSRRLLRTINWQSNLVRSGGRGGAACLLDNGAGGHAEKWLLRQGHSAHMEGDGILRPPEGRRYP